MSKLLSEKIKNIPIHVWAFLCPVIGIVYSMIYPFKNHTDATVSPRKVLISAGYGALLILSLEYVLPRIIAAIYRFGIMLEDHHINYAILMIVVISALLGMDHVLKKRGERNSD